ncbi:MAG: hypothetical protein WCA43_10395, partial [Bradyrhizobium sp.]
RYASDRRAGGEAGIAPKATAAIAAELATLCELRITTPGNVSSARVGLGTTEVAGLHTRTGTHSCAAHVSGGGMSASPAGRPLLRPHRGCDRERKRKSRSSQNA